MTGETQDSATPVSGNVRARRVSAAVAVSVGVGSLIYGTVLAMPAEAATAVGSPVAACRTSEPASAPASSAAPSEAPSDAPSGAASGSAAAGTPSAGDASAAASAAASSSDSPAASATPGQAECTTLVASGGSAPAQTGTAKPPSASASPTRGKPSASPTTAPTKGKGGPPAAKPSAGPSSIPVSTVTPTGAYYPYTLVPPGDASYQLPHGSITRAQIITRAETWVADRVPYSQTTWFTDGDGTYRQDCSGYVSMAWALDQYTDFWTGNLNLVSSTVPPSALLPGDILLSVKHTIIFAGWADARHTQFDYYEEAHPNTVARYVVDAPLSAFLDNGFAPFRYDGVLDSAALPANPSDGIAYATLVRQGSEVDPAGVLSGKLAGLDAEDQTSDDAPAASASPSTRQPVIAAQAAADVSDGPDRKDEGLVLGAAGALLIGAGLFIRKPIRALPLARRRGGKGGSGEGGGE